MITEDDFDYIPLKKKTRKKQENDINKPEFRKDLPKKLTASKKDTKRNYSRIKSSQKSNEIKQKGKSPVRDRKKYDGNCPNCQMPFSILVIESPSWHASECVVNFHPKSECPEGADCGCTIQNHYWKFGHKQLAEYRALSKRKKTEQEEKTEVNLKQHKDVSLTTGETINSTDYTLYSVDAYPSTSKVNIDVMITESSISVDGTDLTQSPQDLTDYLEEAFKEATYCSQKNNDGVTVCEDNINSRHSRIHVSDNITENKTLDDQSDLDQSIFNEDKEILFNLKSLSDVSQDSNSKQSISLFEGYKTNTEKSDDSVEQHLFHGMNKKYLLPQEDGSLQLDVKLKNSKYSNDVKIEEVKTACCGQISVVSLSQGSQVSDPVHTIKEKHPRNGSKEKKGKLKRIQKSGILKQTSLLSFFPGNECSSIIENTCDISQDTSENNKKLKNANDILMASMKKSFSEPCMKFAKTLSETSMTRNASKLIISNKADIEKECSQQRMTNEKLKIAEKDNYPNTSRMEQKGIDKSDKFKQYCPFYKKIPDTGFTVDAFCYGEVKGCHGYFLSHFHYDHYRGLTRKFLQPIYCSKVTGNLVRSRLGVRPDLVHDLPMNTPCIVNNVEVTLLEANHCPGSVLFLFRTTAGKWILHTGDFRANPAMEQIQCLQKKTIQELYLDTTYCDPTYVFPPQKQVVEFVISLVQKILSQTADTLVVCGSYTIGKERIFAAIANTFDCKICVHRDKFKVLECLEDAELTKRLSLDFNASFLHVLPMKKLNISDLDKHVSSLKRNFDQVVAIEPTGWTFNKKMVSLDQIRPKGNKRIQIYGLPYSEHSSFLELKRFVQYIKPRKILPTVNNGNPVKRKQMQDIFSSWMEESKQGI